MTIGRIFCYFIIKITIISSYHVSIYYYYYYYYYYYSTYIKYNIIT